MSLNDYFFHSHLSFFPEKLGDVRYVSPDFMADFCWNFKRITAGVHYKRK